MGKGDEKLIPRAQVAPGIPGVLIAADRVVGIRRLHECGEAPQTNSRKIRPGEFGDAAGGHVATMVVQDLHRVRRRQRLSENCGSDVGAAQFQAGRLCV